jgi:hypothetical protein
VILLLSRDPVDVSGSWLFFGFPSVDDPISTYDVPPRAAEVGMKLREEGRFMN